MQEGAEGATSEVREADLEEVAEGEEDSMVTEARAAEATTALTEEAEAGLVAVGGDRHQTETTAAEAETRAGAMEVAAAEGDDSPVSADEITIYLVVS